MRVIIDVHILLISSTQVVLVNMIRLYRRGQLRTGFTCKTIFSSWLWSFLAGDGDYMCETKVLYKPRLKMDHVLYGNRRWCISNTLCKSYIRDVMTTWHLSTSMAHTIALGKMHPLITVICVYHMGDSHPNSLSLMLSSTIFLPWLLFLSLYILENLNIFLLILMMSLVSTFRVVEVGW